MMMRGLGDTGVIAAGCQTADPGFMAGLTSWLDPAQYSGNFTNLTDITQAVTWGCYPMMNLGIVAGPVAVIAGLMLLLGKKRR